MASDALFQMLAQAKGQPSRGLRAVESAGKAGEDILGGYLQGNQIAAARSQARLKPYEIYTTIADKIGPERANAIFKQAGMQPPSIPEDTGININTTPEKLLGQGSYGKGILQGRNTIDEMKKREQEMANNMPFASDVADAIGKGDTETLVKIHAAKNEPVPFREMNAAISAKRPAMMGGYFDTKSGTLQLNELPSKLGPSTAAGAAYQVKVAAQQGKSLIAKPGAYQRIGLSQGDAARAILRNSPTDEAMRNANFSDTIIGRYNVLKQKLNSNPEAIDQPEIRKTLYNIFTEMDKSATPFIENHLKNMEANRTNSTFGDKWEEVKRRELGLNLADIPFDAGTNTPTSSMGARKTYQKTARNGQGVVIGSNDNWQTWEPVQGQQ